MIKKTPDLISVADDIQRVLFTDADSDLKVAIIGASYLDTCLRAFLHKKLIKSSITDKILQPDRGILGSLSGKADMLYAMGLMKKDHYENTRTIAEIRNKFAHVHSDVTFETEEVAALCSKIHLIGPVRKTMTVSPRNAYMSTIITMSAYHIFKGIGNNELSLVEVLENARELKH
jgi:DNA-binding MltR family transcriptional regulator